MSAQRMGGMAVALCLATAMALVGCQQDRRDRRAPQPDAAEAVEPSVSTETHRDYGLTRDLGETAGPRVTRRPERPRREVRREEPRPERAPRGEVVCASLAYPTGNKATSALWLEKCAPREVTAGQPFDYTLRITNLTDMHLDDVRVNDTVPEGFRMSRADPQPAEGAAGEDGVMTWNLGRLAPRATRTIVITGNASGQGQLVNCATVTYNPTACLTVAVVAPQLEITKRAPSDVLICEPIPLHFVVRNTGSGTARNVRIIDNLPEGLTTADGKQEITLDAGNLAAGQSREFTVNARATRRGSFNNTARAEAQGLTAETTPTTTNVREPVLEIVKRAPANEFLGREFTSEITVRNTGDGPARNTVLSDQVPQGASFVSASEGGSRRGNRVTWDLGTIEPGASRAVQLVMRADRVGEVRNTAAVEAVCVRPAQASTVTRVTGIPALLLEVVDLDDPVRVGTQTTYQITVTNQGTMAGTNIVVAVTLEDSMAYVSSDGPTRGAVQDQRITFAPLPSLPPKAMATWQVVVRATKVADARFKVNMNSDQLDRDVEETESTNFYE